MQWVPTIFFWSKAKLVSESEEKKHLHKWWLIAKASFPHAPQINVSPVFFFTAYLTLSNRTVRDICHVTGWRCRVLPPSEPTGGGKTSATGSAVGLGLRNFKQRGERYWTRSFSCKQNNDTLSQFTPEKSVIKSQDKQLHRRCTFLLWNVESKHFQP